MIVCLLCLLFVCPFIRSFVRFLLCLSVSQSGECSHASYHFVDGRYDYSIGCARIKKQNVCDLRVFFSRAQYSVLSASFFSVVFLLCPVGTRSQLLARTPHCHRYRYKLLLVLVLVLLFFLFVHTINKIGRLLLLSHSVFVLSCFDEICSALVLRFK